MYMTKIEKLYQSIETLKELGAQLPKDLIDETNRIEEEIIKDEIIPSLSESINPIISQIQREIILVIEYIPDEPLQVKLTRKRSLSIPADLDFTNSNNKNSSDRKTFTIPNHSKSSKSVLRVTFPDGKTISDNFAYQTLIETIKTIGVERVKQLNIICSGVPLVSNKKDDFYNQHEISRGLYIMTHSSTRTKKDQLQTISQKLNLGLKIEII